MDANYLVNNLIGIIVILFVLFCMWGVWYYGGNAIGVAEDVERGRREQPDTTKPAHVVAYNPNPNWVDTGPQYTITTQTEGQEREQQTRGNPSKYTTATVMEPRKLVTGGRVDKKSQYQPIHGQRCKNCGGAYGGEINPCACVDVEVTYQPGRGEVQKSIYDQMMEQ